MVAEKTGYPQDMLDLDLDLEADLGIDTVKQAELFATVREAYGIPRDDNLKLRDFPTLEHVIGFVVQRAGATPDAAPVDQVAAAPVEEVAAAPAPTSEAAPAGVNEDEVREQVLALVAEKTGYPQDMLDLDLDLEADLGIDTVKQAELFATVREAYGIPRDDNLKLRDFPTLEHVIGFVVQRAGATPDAAPVHQAAAAPVEEVAAAPAPRVRRRPPGSTKTRCASRSWRWWPRRPVTPRTCSISIWISKPTWASTRSSRRSCSPPCARPTASPATTT